MYFINVFGNSKNFIVKKRESMRVIYQQQQQKGEREREKDGGRKGGKT